MPIFEYKCSDCQKVFEKLTFGEEEIVCPYCGSNNVKKLVSLFASLGLDRGSSGCSSCSSGSCSSCR